jgi:hypothetical protein
MCSEDVCLQQLHFATVGIYNFHFSNTSAECFAPRFVTYLLMYENISQRRCPLQTQKCVGQPAVRERAIAGLPES